MQEDADSGVTGAPRSAPERYVRECVQAGKEADLILRFGFEVEHRELRAEFVAELLTGGLTGGRLPRRGVRIRGAVITGALDLEDAEVEGPVQIWQSRFQGRVKFREARFGKKFSVWQSEFAGAVDFYGMRVGGGFSCQAASFEGGADLRAAEIKGQLDARGARFTSPEEANFNGMKVGGSAFFGGAEFAGAVNLVKAEIGGQLAAQGAKFTSPAGTANFNGMKVGGDAFFEGAEFAGAVNLVTAEIGGQLAAQGARFTSPAETANFNGMKVGSDAFFGGAEFAGPVDWRYLEIKINLQADEAKWHFRHAGELLHGMTAEVDASFMKVGQRVYFRNTVFEGRVALAGAHLLDLHLSAPELRELNLERARIGRELKIGRPEGEKKTVIHRLKCDNLRVEGPARLEEATIIEEADFRDASFQQVKLLKIEWPAAEKQRRQTAGDGARQAGRHKIRLDGLTYLGITTGEQEEERPGWRQRWWRWLQATVTREPRKEPQDWKRLLNWLEQSRFNTQNYAQLEAYWQRCGQRARADKVFITGKRRELKRRPWYIRWPLRVFGDGLTGYGRKAGRIFGVGLVLVIVGAVLFDPQILPPAGGGNRATPVEAAAANPGSEAGAAGRWGRLQEKRFYEEAALRLVISADRLLPTWVDLGYAREYRPQAEKGPWWLFIYWNVHRVLGWVLVAMGIAGLTLRFK